MIPKQGKNIEETGSENESTQCHHRMTKRAAPEDKEGNIRSIGEDSNHIWEQVADDNINKLEMFENNAFSRFKLTS